MPNFTRKAIKESFLKLLSQRPLRLPWGRPAGAQAADLPEIGGDIVLHAAVKPVNDGAKAGAAVIADRAGLDRPAADIRRDGLYLRCYGCGDSGRWFV